MAAIELEGSTLGKKHQNYNKLLKDALENKKVVSVKDFNPNDCDVVNLLNIDIASHTKNVEYILKVLVCDDMLYVSRVIKQSDWLINDNCYAHIINPVYLCTNLFPHMCSKAVIKLMKHLRLTLKDEKRAQQFHDHEEYPEDAAKWLPNCSLDFIHENMKYDHQHISMSLLRRLCEKSISILEVYIENEKTTRSQTHNALQNTIFLLSCDTNRYLDIVEKHFNFPTFNKRATNIILKNCFDRIRDKFENYYQCIHLPTFLKYLKRENVKTFLLNLTQYMEHNQRINIYSHTLGLFLNFMPSVERFEFVKQVFIDKIHYFTDPGILTDEEKKAMNVFRDCICNNIHPSEHYWYQFAPFEVALPKIKNLFNATSSDSQKTSMLFLLISSARQNTEHMLNFLNFVHTKINNIRGLDQVVTKILCEINLETCDQRIWSSLVEILEYIGIYNDKKWSGTTIIETVIVHEALSKRKISEIVEQKFNFNSLAPYHKNLTETARETLFIYLYNFIITKLQACNVTTEDEFNEKINLLEQALNLLNDFKKDLSKYPILINTIREFIKIRSDNKWETNLSSLYNIKKEWRKFLFHESLVLYPTESALINALKHDPALLQLYKNEVNNILFNDDIPFNYALRKIKIYWANSLTKHITALYIENLYDIEKHKVTTRGLSILMSRNDLQNILEQYAPKEAKIDWSKIDEVTLGLQKHFAKTMHVARPQPFPEAILWYSKGDYIQYALPSVLSIFYNLNAISCRNYMKYLLDAPVSLQKHGIRIAVSKFELDELLPLVNNVWKSSKNSTVRAVLFKSMFDILCKEEDLTKIKTTFDLVEMFFDNLTLQEDKSIYKLLFEVENVPLNVRGEFYTRSYKLLKKLLEAGSEEFKDNFYTTFTKYSVNMMEQLCPEFVADIIKDFVDKKFTVHKCNNWRHECTVLVISSFLLCAKNEKTQLERYETIFQPIVRRCFPLWNETENEEYFVRINLAHLLDNLRSDVEEYVVKKEMVVPFKMFLLLQKELEQTLTVPENYMLLTKWQFTVNFIHTLYKHQPILNWKEACATVAVEFGNKCKTDLKDHCDKYFSRIYLLFIEALGSMLNGFVPKIVHGEIFGSFLHDDDFIQGYLSTLKMLSWSHEYIDDEKEREELKNKFDELRKIISMHPSPEVRIHYFNALETE